MCLYGGRIPSECGILMWLGTAAILKTLLDCQILNYPSIPWQELFLWLELWVCPFMEI